MVSKYKYTGFNGMDEFIDAVDTIQREAPGRLVKELRREARQVVNSYKKRVKPHRITGNLEKAIEFKKNDVYVRGSDFEAEIKDNLRKAPHFHLVERGHDQVVGGRKGKTGVVVGHVQGRYYFENTLKAEEPRLQASRERYIERILKELM